MPRGRDHTCVAEPAECGRVGGQGFPVVGAEAFGPTARFEEAGAHELGVGYPGRREGVTAEANAAGAIGQPQGITGQAVSGVQQACEIGAPAIVGRALSVGGVQG